MSLDPNKKLTLPPNLPFLAPRTSFLPSFVRWMVTWGSPGRREPRERERERVWVSARRVEIEIAGEPRRGVHGVAATMALPKGLIRRQRGRDRNGAAVEGRQKERFSCKKTRPEDKGVRTDRTGDFGSNEQKERLIPTCYPEETIRARSSRHCSSSLPLSHFAALFLPRN